MTGQQLARKLETPGLLEEVTKLVSEEGRLRMWSLLGIMIMSLRRYSYRETQVKLSELETIFRDSRTDIKVTDWLPGLERALRKLGRYDVSDDFPWNGEPGSCSACEEYVGGDSCDIKSYQYCPQCYRRFHNRKAYETNSGWVQVTDYVQWDEIRRQVLSGDPATQSSA